MTTACFVMGVGVTSGVGREVCVGGCLNDRIYIYMYRRRMVIHHTDLDGADEGDL